MILKLKNTKFDFFDQITVQLNYDTVGSTFSFTGLFDPDYSVHKDLFKPLTYPQVVVEHNDETLITGTLLNHNFGVSKVKQPVTLSGYSLPGVLENCEIPPSLYPLQSDKRTLGDIATRIAEKFGLTVEVDSAVQAAVDKKYDTTKASESQTIKAYLQELAAQRNIILSHTAEGALLFTRANTSQKPIARFEEGAPGVSMALAVSGENMYSEITVQRQSSIAGKNAGHSTVLSDLVGAFRSKVKSQSSGDDNDTQDAAKTVLAAQLKNIKMVINTDRWDWLNEGGGLMKPNSIITVNSPGNYLYNDTRLFVESVKFTGNKTSKTAQLTCVLPEVFNRETPKNIFE